VADDREALLRESANLDVTESAASAAVQIGRERVGRATRNAAFAFAYAGRPRLGRRQRPHQQRLLPQRVEWFDDRGLLLWYSARSCSTPTSCSKTTAPHVRRGHVGCSGGMFIEDVATHESGTRSALATRTSRTRRCIEHPVLQPGPPLLDRTMWRAWRRVSARGHAAGAPTNRPGHDQRRERSGPAKCASPDGPPRRTRILLRGADRPASRGDAVARAPKDTTSYLASGSSADTTYSFACAQQQPGYSDYSNVASATTASAPPPATPAKHALEPGAANSATA